MSSTSVAFVGFSSPIGYDYENVAAKTDNDLSSSPNPVLLGGVGTICFYDEIWFASKSLCPQNMRQLDFVRFLDVEKPGLNLLEQGFFDFVNQDIQFEKSTALHDVFDGNYGEEMKKYLGFRAPVDNHTHSISFYDGEFQGNLMYRQICADLWLLEHFKELNATWITNPLTAKALKIGDLNTNQRDDSTFGYMAESIITLNGLFDVTSPAGPFHPSLLKLRNEGTIQSFRNWLKGEQSSLHNKRPEMIAEEVREEVVRFQRELLLKAAQPKRFVETSYEILTAFVASKLPFLSEFHKIRLAHKENQKKRENAWRIFVARAHLELEGSTK